jgi:transposase
MPPYVPVGGTVPGPGGQPVTYPRRDVVDAIRYLDHNSVVCRALPADFPPWETVYHYFRTSNRDGTLTRIHNGLREQVRLAEGRHVEPSAAVLDSQSVRGAEIVRQGRSSGRALHLVPVSGGWTVYHCRTRRSSDLPLIAYLHSVTHFS